MAIKTYPMNTIAERMDRIRNKIGLDAARKYSRMFGAAEKYSLTFSGVRITPRGAKDLNDIIATTFAQLIMPQKIGKTMKILYCNSELKELSKNDAAQVQARVF